VTGLRARLMVSPLRLMGAPGITSVRARKVRPYSVAGKLPAVANLQGMNQPETRVAMALQELGISFETQSNFLGGSILGGARADFVLPDFRIILLVDGPFHRTDYGLARDVLVDATYRAAGFTVVHFSTTLVDANLKQNIVNAIGVPL